MDLNLDLYSRILQYFYQVKNIWIWPVQVYEKPNQMSSSRRPFWEGQDGGRTGLEEFLIFMQTHKWLDLCFQMPVCQNLFEKVRNILQILLFLAHI